MYNLLAVLGASIAGFIAGALWFGPLFGSVWMKYHNFTKKDINARKTKMATRYLATFIGVLVTAAVLEYLMHRLGIINFWHGVVIGILLWLGLQMAVQLNTVLWEGKPFGLLTINAGHELVVTGLMAGILAVW